MFFNQKSPFGRFDKLTAGWLRAVSEAEPEVSFKF
jgi:hypothetical protein